MWPLDFSGGSPSVSRLTAIAVQINQVGLNHLTWIREVLVDGMDRLPQILDEDGDDLAKEVGLDPAQLKSLRAIPSYYLRYYYREPQMVAEAETHPTRAASVIDIEAELLDMYRDPNVVQKPALLERRGGAFYSEAAVQLIASLHDGRGDTQVVDIFNRGTLPDLDDDAVVEVPARISQDGAVPLPQKPLDPASSALAKRVKNYERLAVQAARTGNREVALDALRTNPLTGSPERAPQLLEAILDANRQWLPAFFS